MTINVRHLVNKKKYNNFILILEYNSSNDVIKSTGRKTEDANRT